MYVAFERHLMFIIMSSNYNLVWDNKKICSKIQIILQEKQEDVIIDKKRKYYPIFTFMKQGTTGTGSGPTQRVFTGTVTKFHENFGFVDEDVFFQTSVVKGQTPRVNVCTSITNQSISNILCRYCVKPNTLIYFLKYHTLIDVE